MRFFKGASNLRNSHCFALAKTDISFDGVAEQKDVLHYTRNCPAQNSKRKLADINSINLNASACNIVHTLKQIYDCSFTGTCCTHNSKSLTGANLKRNIIQYCAFANLVSYVVKFNFTADIISCKQGISNFFFSFPTSSQRRFIPDLRQLLVNVIDSSERGLCTRDSVCKPADHFNRPHKSTDVAKQCHELPYCKRFPACKRISLYNHKSAKKTGSGT